VHPTPQFPPYTPFQPSRLAVEEVSQDARRARAEFNQFAGQTGDLQ